MQYSKKTFSKWKDQSSSDKLFMTKKCGTKYFGRKWIGQMTFGRIDSSESRMSLVDCLSDKCFLAARGGTKKS